MNIILCGYGKMGKELEKELQGHNLFIVSKETNTNFDDIEEKIDVIIDFSYPDMIYKIEEFVSNKNHISLILGTTSYNQKHLEIINNISETHKVILFSNYSKGINILLKLLKLLSSYIEDEQIYLIEKHHKLKKDIPSGTSISIEEIFKKNINILSLREGEIKGEHQLDVYFNYEMISIKHVAYSRKAFVEGVVHILKMINQLEVGLYTKENFDIWKEKKLLN